MTRHPIRRALGRIKRTAGAAVLWACRPLLIRLIPRMSASAAADDELARQASNLAPLISRMAHTGVGTDECLRHRCLPVPVNFYSPIPDLTDLEQRRVWDRVSDLAGVDFNPEGQVARMNRLASRFGDECQWPREATADPTQFYSENVSFGWGCAASTHCVLRQVKPRRVVEIGSGFSSLVIAAALRKNAAQTGTPAEYTIVDPYPGPVVAGGLPGVSQLVSQRVELLEPAFFDQLSEGDVLFVDSGHSVRIGGDVNFLILDVLPRLARGVVIHFHDISLPHEYSRAYATNPAFRQFWTEAYLLQAFLAHNHEFEILMALQYLMTDRLAEFRAAFTHYDPDRHWAISGSFWIRRRGRAGLTDPGRTTV